MLGTGLSASSLSESTMPSRMSSSSTVGTYCRQIGSSGDLIRSTMAGEIRNSKFSAACRRRSRSGKCSGPNLAASTSRDLIELVLRTSCQVSMRLSVLLTESANQHLRVIPASCSYVFLSEAKEACLEACLLRFAQGDWPASRRATAGSDFVYTT